VSIRVLGGELRGRQLRTVPGRGTRPLLAQVRAALFNILVGEFEDAVVWDLFAGTGASGIEALSRGARRVVFVEKSNQALRVLRGNLEDLALGDRGQVVRANAWDPPLIGDRQPDEPETEMAGTVTEAAPIDALEVPPDVVFLDPPYADVELDPTLAVSRARDLMARLRPDGVLVFHFAEGVLDADDLQPLGELDLRVWGGSAVAIVRRRL
jgi:16S rRNA G966 N2-methylase RsmD